MAGIKATKWRSQEKDIEIESINKRLEMDFEDTLDRLQEIVDNNREAYDSLNRLVELLAKK